MRDRPQGQELLAIAAKTFREELLPALPEARRYSALMLLNALSIAERQLAAGDDGLHAETARLAALLALPAQAGEDWRAHLLRLQRELARRVRAGAADADPALQQVLWDTTLARVRESSPRYLKAEGIG